MKKFLVVLQKEIRELITPQMLIPVVVMMIVFSILGNLLSKEVAEEAKTSTQISIIDEDKTKLSETITESLGLAGFEITDVTQEDNTSVKYVIPKGFEDSINKGENSTIDVYTSLKSFSTLGNTQVQKLAPVLDGINSITSNIIIAEKTDIQDAAFISSPVVASHHVEINGKKADIDPQAVLGYTISQTTFIPIVLFMVITMAAQLVAVAIASEKENKTLETLLSLPVNRNAIVIAKLLGAALVSALFAAFYMWGMRSYMNGITGGFVSTDTSTATSIAIEKLGLLFTTPDYILLGISLFMGILVALTISFILGSFANDTKGAQGITTPVMILLLIPYLLSILTDINSLSRPLQIVLKAIPFTHTFMAAQNIMLNNYSSVYMGLVYMIVLVVIGVIVATKLFNSEKIFTMKLNFLKSRK